MKNLMFYLTVAIIMIACSNHKSSKETENKSITGNERTSEVKVTDEKTSNEIYITNEGIAGLKLGMTLEDVKSELADFVCEKVIMEIDQIEYYKLMKGEKHICQFELDQSANIAHISIGDEYKTKEGIGILSTVEEVKKHYTLLPYKIVEGAEGLPFVCLTIKEMPNLQMWLNYEVPEDYYKDEKKVLTNVPETSKIIDIYVEKSIE